MASYQGSKAQYATQICNLMRRYCPNYQQIPFYDLCCGAGFISSQWPFRNFMVDKGAWGKFWEIYYLNRNEVECYFADMIPRLKRSDLRDYCNRLLKDVVSDDHTYCLDFLLLQANAFQGKPLKEDKFWRYPGFEPEVNLTKMDRLWVRIKRTLIRGAMQLDINDMQIKEPALVYIDPDYKGTTGYFNDSVNVKKFVESHPHCSIFVSESTPIADVAWDDIVELNQTHVYRANGGNELVHFKKALVS